MPRFLQLWIAYIRIALIRNMEFRSQFITECFIGVLWIVLMFVTAQFFFLHTNDIGGWSKQDIYLLIVVWGLSKELFNAFFWAGLGLLAEQVFQGKFDVLLLRPVHPIWQLACSRFDMPNVLMFFVHLGLFIYFAIQSQLQFTFMNSAAFIMLFCCALVIHFAIHLFLQSLIFWFPNIDNIRYLYHAIADMGQYPASVYKSAQVLFFTIIPIAYLGTVPTLFLLGKGSLRLFILSLIVTVGSLSISLLVFKYGASRYSSASS